MTQITLQLTGIAHGGEAIGRHEGKIVFVPYAIPGETVKVEYVAEKARWARARLVEVLESSPERVEPPCSYFGPGLCGGCQWQHVDYESQLRFKAEIVADQLRRLGRIAEPPVLDPIALADEEGLLAFGYRNYSQFQADGQGRLGYRRDAQGREREDGEHPSQDVIPIEECLLLHPLLDEMHSALLSGGQGPNAAGASAALPGQQAGEAEEAEEADSAPPVQIRRVSLRAAVNTGQRLLIFETRDDRAPGFLVEDLPARFIIRRRDGTIQSLIGEPWIDEIIAGRTFRVSAASFFPVNTTGAEAMVELAAEMLAPAGHETLLDAYCGVGLFGLSLARQVGQVIGIEESEEACEDFAWNARDLDNVALFEGPVAEVLATFSGPDDSDPTQRADMAIIDPPSSGAGPEVVAQLRRLQVRRLLYVSHDPATLARDARLLLDAGYRIQQVQPIDLFPQTYRVQSLALFTL